MLLYNTVSPVSCQDRCVMSSHGRIVGTWVNAQKTDKTGGGCL